MYKKNFAIYKMNTFLVPIITLIFFIVVLLPYPAFAIIYLGGGTNTVTDVQNRNETYFGGSDSTQLGGDQTNPVNFTFTTTPGAPPNIVNNIFGGSSVTGGTQNSVNGDIVLNVFNTNFIINPVNNDGILVGGSLADNGLATVNGSIYLTTSNCTIPGEIVGGCYGTINPNNRTCVNGSIYINLDNITTDFLYGGSRGIAGCRNGVAVTGDINITVNNSTFRTIYLNTDEADSHLGGDATLNITNSIVRNIAATYESDIVGNVVMNIGPGTQVSGYIRPSYTGTIIGTTTINVNGAVVAGHIRLGPLSDAAIGPVILNVSDSTIRFITSSPGVANGFLSSATVNIYSGDIEALELGGNPGITQSAIANIYGGQTSIVYLGNTNVNAKGTTATLNISGGSLKEIYIAGGGTENFASVNFLPGHQSRYSWGMDGVKPLDLLTIQKNARTEWGREPNEGTFWLDIKDFLFAGELFIAPMSRIELNMHGNLTAEGGIIIPKGITPQTKSPVLALTANPGSHVTVHSPLSFQLSYSPDLLGATNIPVVTATGALADPALFAKHNATGLLWSDTVFDPIHGVWSLTNIRPSEDFYAFSAAREASSWLRQQHVWGIQRRSNNVLVHNNDGLWLNVQSGHEKLDAAIGKAKMPWVMASIGYDFLHTLPFLSSLKALYGLGMGISEGHDKWHTINNTKNDIKMGLVAVYLGLIHDTGIYGTATAQLASNRTTTKCTGFNKNYKWSETVPTEVLELGWQYSFMNGCRINPRGQVILEQLTKRHFKLPYENDTAILEKSFITTTVLGLAGEYEFQLGTLINIQASVDWIKGVAGDFAAKSRILKRKFKDKNDTSVVRTALGIGAQLQEHFSVNLDGFADFGQDKGFGGQLGATYKF